MAYYKYPHISNCKWEVIEYREPSMALSDGTEMSSVVCYQRWERKHYTRTIGMFFTVNCTCTDSLSYLLSFCFHPRVQPLRGQESQLLCRQCWLLSQSGVLPVRVPRGVRWCVARGHHHTWRDLHWLVLVNILGYLSMFKGMLTLS